MFVLLHSAWLFDFKTVSCNALLIPPNTNTEDAYHRLVQLLKSNKIAYHTYQPREERSYRVVIKNIHNSIPAHDIKEALEELGYAIRGVTNVRS